MDALFEAQFSPLADSGRLLSKCGKCSKYMKYISTRPTRLYCIGCEEVYNLPQNGTIKVCLLDFILLSTIPKEYPFNVKRMLEGHHSSPKKLCY